MKNQEAARFNVYDNGKLIGQDYKRENGEWSHKWMTKEGVFERGSWRGRCDNDNSKNYKYEPITL